MSTSARLAVVCGSALGVAACSGGSTPPETPGATTTATATAAATATTETGSEAKAGAPAFVAQVDGKPVGFKSVLASTVGGSAIEIVASTDSIDCAALAKAPGAEEKRARLLLSPALAPDGKRTWKLVFASYVNGTTSENEAVPDVQGDAKAGVTATVPQVSFAFMDPSGSKPVELGGPIKAVGCGDLGKDAAPPRPQKDAVLEVAGQKLALQGAVLQRSKEGDTLVVSTRPIPCENGVPGEDVRLHVNLPKAKGAEASVLISGDLVPGMTPLYFGDKKPKVTPGAVRDGVVLVTVDLDEKHGDYAVKLKGSVQAALCEKK